MPYAPQPRCAAPMCPSLATYRGRCQAHATERDRYRGSRQERGYDADWERFRKWFLSIYPLCLDCRIAGKVQMATDVHHLHKLADGGARLDPDNCMALCHSCHSVRTERGE